jgi:hypothetical protein
MATKSKAQEALEKKGYKITYAISGNTIYATKGQQTYSAASISALKKRVLG